jgi:membrane protein DedA with SNARE-associated domain/rhodanese-related sulfurtransferase
MTSAAQALGEHGGLALVFLNVLLEQAGLPIPAVPTLFLAGATAAGQPEWGASAFALAAIACLIADVAWYYAGRAYGTRVMRLLCRISLSPDSCVSNTQVRFERWGMKAIVFAKFVPGLSVIAPPLAGATRMGIARYVRLSLLGSVLWIAAPMTLGAFAAPQITALIPRMGGLGVRAAIVAGVLLALYVLLKWLQRRRFYSALRMARIDAGELQSMMHRSRAPTILDVRSSSALELDPRMVPGALHVPPEHVPGLLSSINHDGEVVVYCTCPNEASAAQVARLLMRHGVRRVRPLHGGLDAWIAGGYKVSTARRTPSEAIAATAVARQS